jgi:hypothetical protein
MRNSLIIFLLAAIMTSASYGQEFKPFKVGVGLGYAAPGSTGKGAGGGILMFLEPAYRATDIIQIGLRIESAVIVRGVTGMNNNNDVSGDASSNVSYTLNGQYYFGTKNVRPFVGVGLGLFSLAAVKFNTATSTSSNVSPQTQFGFYPRIGFDAGHFQMSLDYNIVPSTSIPGGGEVKNSYLGIRAGVSIGGGRINK